MKIMTEDGIIREVDELSNVTISNGIINIDGRDTIFTGEKIYKIYIQGDIETLICDAPITVNGNIDSINSDAPIKITGDVIAIKGDGPISVSGNYKSKEQTLNDIKKAKTKKEKGLFNKISDGILEFISDIL